MILRPPPLFFTHGLLLVASALLLLCGVLLLLLMPLVPVLSASLAFPVMRTLASHSCAPHLLWASLYFD